MKQYVVDPSSNTIMKEEQERIDGKVALAICVALVTFVTLLIMSLLPNRCRTLQNAKQAVTHLRKEDLLAQLSQGAGSAASVGKEAVKSVRDQGLCKKCICPLGRLFK